MERRLEHAVVALAALIAIGAGTGCAMRTVHSFAARGVNLNHYHRYAWAPATRAATGDPRLDNNEIFREHLRTSIERQLQAKGLRSGGSDQPDVVLHYHASVSQRINLHELAPWDACPECRPFVFDAGTLVVDVVDARTDTLLWRGWSETNIGSVVDDQQQLEAHVDDAVARIFARFPRAAD